VLLACGLAVHADSAPYEATVTAAEVEIRCGPSADPKYYATSKLRQGEKVQVVREEDGGWLAIKPPHGSFSWINTRFIETVGKDAARVVGDDVPVRIGSEILNAPPTVEAKVKLKRGAQVVVLDSHGMPTEEGTWLPIAPIPDEVRYIPGDAVKATPKVQVVQSSPQGTAAMPQGPTAVTTSNAPPGSDQALWEQAQEAERTGRAADAVDIYVQLSNRTSSHELQIRCYNRIHFLREGMRGSVPYNYQPGHPPEAHYPAPPSNDPRLIPSPSYVPGQRVAPGQVTSQYTYQRDTQPPTFQPGAPLPAPANPLRTSGPGWLRRAPFWLDQKVTYVLESSQGMPRMYLTAQPGLNLELFVGRNVDLTGTVVYRGDVKTYYMTVTQVRVLQ
jgi:hypothetical protein